MRKVVKHKDIKLMGSEIKAAFNVVKSEMDVFREDFNESTNEFQAIYELVYALQAENQKLREDVDELKLELTGKKKFDAKVGRLLLREKEVALVLYMESAPQSAGAIARRTGLTEDLVMGYIGNLESKGVPIVKSDDGSLTFFSFSKEFRDLQAKDNVLQIGEVLTEGMQYQ